VLPGHWSFPSLYPPPPRSTYITLRNLIKEQGPFSAIYLRDCKHIPADDMQNIEL